MSFTSVANAPSRSSTHERIATLERRRRRRSSLLAAVVVVALSRGPPGASGTSTGAIATTLPSPRRVATTTPTSVVDARREDDVFASVLIASRNEVRGGGDDAAVAGGLAQRLKVTFYFGLWYFLNVIFNIVNKKLLNVVPAPLSVGCLQLFVGSIFAISMWATGLRARPTLTVEGRARVRNVGLAHGGGQLLSMVSLSAGPVSFTHIVKALEPLFSAVVSAVLFGKVMAWPVYASLLPVVGGVGYACLKERYFSWLAFNTAMGSNLAFAFRAAESKRVLAGAQDGTFGTNLTPPNTFAVVTIAAALLSVPVLFADGNKLVEAWTSPEIHGTTPLSLVRAVIVSGLFHYLNNEVMYLALGNVHPVTLAVGNTMKRVFIMVASVLVFRNPVSVQAGVGSAVGISGVLLYSLTKQRYEQPESETQNDKNK